MNEILERMASDVQALNGNTSGNYPFVLFQNNYVCYFGMSNFSLEN